MSGRGTAGHAGSEGEGEREGARPRPPPWRDWQLWVAFAVSALAIALTLKGVDFAEVGRALGEAQWPFLLGVPVLHWLALWVRALRWRRLTVALSDLPLPLGAHYRATAIGFMTINLLPMRLGEFVRPLVLARELSVSASAAFGTLVIERAFDFACAAALGAALLALHAHALPAWVRSAAVALLLAGALPFALIAALRLAKARTLALIDTLLSPLPERVARFLGGFARELCRGLDGLRGAAALAEVMLWSLVLWCVLFAAPFALGFAAFGIELPLGEFLLATLTVHVFVALAVAAPAAPGFLGVFHFACREALVLFGVSPSTALAYGTLLHLAYWLPITAVGAWSTLRAGLRMGDLAPARGKGPPMPLR